MQRCVVKFNSLSRSLVGKASIRCLSSSVRHCDAAVLTDDRACDSSISFATCDAEKLSGSQQHQMHNLVQGEWRQTSNSIKLLDPLNGERFISVPDTSFEEISPFVQSLRACPKSGLHNPLKKPERYILYGEVMAKAAYVLKQPQVETFFARLIQRVSPKSFSQAVGEVTVTQKFLENFSGDQVRFLARSFAVPGNHPGQQSTGMRWPYGPWAC